jgi:hypothetical protein
MKGVPLGVRPDNGFLILEPQNFFPTMHLAVLGIVTLPLSCYVLLEPYSAKKAHVNNHMGFSYVIERGQRGSAV